MNKTITAKPKRVRVTSWELCAAWNDNAALKLLTRRILKSLRPKGELTRNPVFVQYFVSFPDSKKNLDEILVRIQNVFSLWNLRRVELWISNGVDFRPTELIWLRQSQRGMRAEFEIEKREPFTWDTVVKEREALMREALK